MPELPEVETVRRQLAPVVEDRTLVALEVSDPRWTQPLDPQEVADAVEGRRVEALERRGKYLDLRLEDGVHLLMHLRMTGTLLLDPEPDPATGRVPYSRVRIALDDGRSLRFCDPRRFGTGELARSTAEREAFFAARLGVEPLDPPLRGAHLRDLARGSRAPVKAFLLDQRKVAGVGNIYADEALFHARVHPQRRAGTLRAAQWDAIAEGVVRALTAGLAAGGATIDDFRHADGLIGSFQDDFQVHRRAGEPCPRCATPIRKLVVGGRGIYVCPRCQPVPRGANRAG